MLEQLRHRAGAHDDAGVSLIELMVAILLFGLLSTAALTTLNFTINLTRQDRNRVAASTLAQRELEVTRNQFFSKLQGPKTISVNQVVNPNPVPATQAVGQPSIVDSVAYTVTREAEWQTPAGVGTSSPCDNGGTAELAYLHVAVSVTWVRMGSVKPVTSDTLLTPTKGTYSDTTGHIGVKVVDRDGAIVSGQSVSVSGPSGTTTSNTESDGCAIFAFLPPGAYTVTLLKPGYVDQSGASAPSYSATVTAGTIYKLPVAWDERAKIDLTLVPPVGASAPNDLPVTLVNSGFTLGTKAYAGTGLTRSLDDLWPYLNGYEAYVGDCADADPQKAGYTGGDRLGPVTTDPGGTQSATLNLFPVLINSTSTNVTSKAIWAKHAADSKCSAGDVVNLGTASSAGVLLSSLPYGTWALWSGSTGTTNLNKTISITPSAPAGSYP